MKKEGELRRVNCGVNRRLCRSVFHGVLRADTRAGTEAYADELVSLQERDLARLRAKDPAVIARARAAADADAETRHTRASGGEGRPPLDGGKPS